MHSDFDHWVGAAVDCFEDDGSLKSGNITKFDELLQLIVEEWNISNEEFHASNEVITRKVRSVLQDARDESDPVRYVHQSKGRIQKELGTKSLATYTITFPLNLTLSNWNNPQEIHNSREVYPKSCFKRAAGIGGSRMDCIGG